MHTHMEAQDTHFMHMHKILTKFPQSPAHYHNHILNRSNKICVISILFYFTFIMQEPGPFPVVYIHVISSLISSEAKLGV